MIIKTKQEKLVTCIFNHITYSIVSQVIYIYKSFSTDADIVCSRAKNHYPPGGFDTDTGTQVSQSSDLLERQKKAYMPLNAKQANVMYFMVSYWSCSKK